jgi:hypothetical protein
MAVKYRMASADEASMIKLISCYFEWGKSTPFGKVASSGAEEPNAGN